MSAPYTSGFATVSPTSPVALPVRGRLPDWLAGTLLRVGPGQFEVGAQHYAHWFDGLALLHRFTFAGGGVTYASAFLQTRAYQAAQREGRIAYREFATDATPRPLERARALLDARYSDNAAVSVARFGAEHAALTERPLAVRFDPRTLATLGVERHTGVPGQMTSAHPHDDPQRRAHLTYFLAVSPFGSTYHVAARSAGARRWRRLASLRAGASPAYMHSFGYSGRCAILCETPFVLDTRRLVRDRLAFAPAPILRYLTWQQGQPARFTALDLADGGIAGRWEADAFAAFHFVNTFAQDGALVADLLCYPDAAPYTRDFLLANLRDPAYPVRGGELRRYRLLTGKHTAEYETLSGEALELPAIHYAAANARPYRYAYAVGNSALFPNTFFNQLVKVDVQRGETRVRAEPNTYPGEPVFVPRPAGNGEDDGVLLSVVLDGARGVSFLLVLDAPALEEIARADLPVPVPFGFHGAFW